MYLPTVCVRGRQHLSRGMAGIGKEEPVFARGVLLKGLPFQTSNDDIKAFFKSLVIPHENIYVIKFPDSGATGLAFVKLEDEEEIKRALLMDRNHMGTRYIEVRISDESEMYHIMLRARAGVSRNELYKISGHGAKQEYPINRHLETKFAYITGVPRGSQYKEIRNFFAGRLIGRGKIWLLREPGSGHFRGDGYIEFANVDECVLGLQNSGKMIGDSVVAVQPCEMEEAVEWSEGNLGDSGRDMEYRQSRMVHEGPWGGRGGGGSGRGGHDQGDGHDDRRDRNHKRTPSPARRRREMYTATYGRNTLLRDDPYGEAGPEGGCFPFEGLEPPNGGFTTSQFRAGGSSQFGLTLNAGGGAGDNPHLPPEVLGNFRRSGGGGPSLDTFLGVAYGGHATIARQPEKPFVPMFSGVLPPTASARPLMPVTGSSVAASPERRVVRVEGLPYNVTVPQILDFFQGYELCYDDVRIQCRDDGSPSGKAFVTCPSERFAHLAVQQLNKRYIGNRYVELFMV